MADSRAKTGWADGTGAVPVPISNWSREDDDKGDYDGDIKGDRSNDEEE